MPSQSKIANSKIITMNCNLHAAPVDKCGLIHGDFWEVAIAGVARQSPFLSNCTLCLRQLQIF